MYALLPNKREITYDRLLAEVKNLIPRANPQWVSMDFERAAMNSFESAFPNTQVLGCFFHLSQNIWKKLKTEGLQQQYANDGNFELLAKMIPAIAFVPIPDLPRYVTDLANHLGGRFRLLPVLISDEHPDSQAVYEHLQFSLPKPGLSMIGL